MSSLSYVVLCICTTIVVLVAIARFVDYHRKLEHKATTAEILAAEFIIKISQVRELKDGAMVPMHTPGMLEQERRAFIREYKQGRTLICPYETRVCKTCRNNYGAWYKEQTVCQRCEQMKLISYSNK